MIRNISYDIILYDENGNKIFSHSETKVMDNNATVSIDKNSSKRLTIDINENTFDKNADLGFTKFYTKISYDIVK
jgi:hypothetical protein